MTGITRRRLLGGIGAAAAVTALAACGQTSTPTATTAAPTAAPTKAAAPATAPTTAPTIAATSATSAGAACPVAGSATSLTGAGATFPAPLYTRWFDEYKKSCNIAVNYQAVGSGAGITQHTQKLVEFGASDGILTAAQKTAAPGTLMIPMTSGSVAVVVNLDGVDSGKLKLTPDTLAGIYLGTITAWDDPKIAADNSGLKLPSQPITVVRRSDGSGTTNIFTSYLSAVSPDWLSKVGKGNSVQWPAGIGGEGNAGVAGAVKQRSGGIGYVELAYAIQNKLTWVALKNKSGAFVEPSLAATTAAMEGVTIPDSTEVMIVNSANAAAYPIAGMTWILVYQDQADKAKAQTLVSLLWWALHDGQKFATELNYAPLSASTITKAEALVKSIKSGGTAIMP